MDPHARLSKPGTKARRLQDVALAELAKHAAAGTLPTSNRFVYYELEQQGVISKVRTGARRSDQDLQGALLYLREHGFVPWDAIVDETRAVTHWRCAPTVRAYLIDTLDVARIDPWGDVKPILITEVRTVAGVLRRGVAQDYLVDVVPTNGQCHGFLITEVVPIFRALLDAGRQPLPLYVGDFDLSGNYIEQHTRRVLERELGVKLPWERLAITEAQTVTLRAQGVEPIDKTDRRFKGRAGQHLAFEAEALGQGVLEQLLRERLDALLPEPLADVLEREARERAALRRRLTRR
jgi:hypothetical protein